MQRKNQFGLSTALKAVVLMAVFFAAVRSLGFAVLIFGSFLSGVILGLWVSHKRKYSDVVCAVIGGVIGAWSGELIILIVLIAGTNGREGRVSTDGLMQFLGAIAGFALGLVFRISYAFRTSTDKEIQDRACKTSLTIVGTVAVILFSVLYAWVWLNMPRLSGS